ncbi:hypothetical protein HKCCE4037_08880 [Rhodobacterales bacterium HKCCE4037]|nr:hypothetical protein [Rhodobacterales bacterium HKCCE4037]
MKITENTPSRFTITCRRPVLADIVLLAFLLFRTGLIYAMLTSERTVLTALLLVIGFVLALVRARGLIRDAPTLPFDVAKRLERWLAGATK